MRKFRSGHTVLAGGELGALVAIEAVARFCRGAWESGVTERRDVWRISDFAAGLQESASSKNKNRSLSTQVGRSPKSEPNMRNTKPADFRGWKVPEVLLWGS